MHLPAETRRRIVFATAALILVGGFSYGWKHKPAPTEKPAAAADESELTAELKALKVPPPASESTAAVATEEEKKPKFQSYKVQPGDTPEAIAAKFGLKTETILWANDLSADDLIQIDQELVIPAVDGVLYRVQSGDNLWTIADEFGSTEEKIAEANPDIDRELIQIGEWVLIPDGQISNRRQVASRGGARAAIRGFDTWPTWGPITDSFGMRTHPVYGTYSFHDGMDIGVGSGTPLQAVSAGTVIMAGRNGSYGIVVRIDHGGGVVTQYAHMSSVDVEVGQQVDSGEHIGYSGNTGVSTGAHLHFSVIVNGSPVDPMAWLP